MRPTYIVPNDKSPSFLNKQALIGAMLGGVLTSGGLGVLIGGGAASVGGWLGARMEKTHGHVVKEPTMINDDMAIGAMAGGLLAKLAVPLALAAIGATGGLAVGLTAVAVAGGLMALGGYIGGKMGEHKMAKEYAQAEILAIEGKAKVIGLIDVSRQPAKSEALTLPEPEQSTSVSQDWQNRVPRKAQTALPAPRAEAFTKQLRAEQTLSQGKARNL